MNEKKNLQEVLSDYLEGALSPEREQQLNQARRNSTELDREIHELGVMLETLHRLPAHEPRLDLWPELEPKLLEIQAEERLGLLARWQLRVARFLSNFASGTILFTQAVALNTESKMRKYVLHDSLILGKEG